MAHLAVIGGRVATLEIELGAFVIGESVGGVGGTGKVVIFNRLVGAVEGLEDVTGIKLILDVAG